MLIRSLTIERFRGIERLIWQPSARINCLIGPGDSGKSTILAAIGLLLDPRPANPASEFDYFQRRVDRGFQITAVLDEVDDAVLAALRSPPPLRGWLEGELMPLPDEGGASPVLVARVVGTSEFEIQHSLLTADGQTQPFPRAARQRVLLARIASSTRANTELRLGRGSLLDRHIRGTGFHDALREAVTASTTSLDLPDETTKAVTELERLFTSVGLPGQLLLGLIAPQGSSLLGLFGLSTGMNASSAIPLALAGTGTRQLALFELGANLVAGSPLVVLDEPEAGLEPYRQRHLIARLRQQVGEGGQAFLTTHSPAVLQALRADEIARQEEGASPVSLAGKQIDRLRREAPDALLARLPILGEGPTEAGFLDPILNAFAASDGVGDIDGLGLRLVFRSGQPTVLDEADELLAAGITIGLFVDNEYNLSGRRATLGANPRCAYGSWPEPVRNVEEAVATWLAWEHLPGVVERAAELRGRPTVDLLQQVNEALGAPGRLNLEELGDRHDEQAVRGALAEAMQAKNKGWFKNLEGGRCLGEHLLQVGLPNELEAPLRAFWERIREVIKCS